MVTIMITDPDGIIEYVNPNFEKQTLFTCEEAIGKNPHFLNASRSPVENAASLWSTIKAGDTWTGHFINRKKDGTKYIEKAHISPVVDSSGKIIHYIAIKEDITKQRKNEHKLKRSQSMLHAILSSSPVGLALLKNRKFIWANKAMSEMSGYNTKELVNQDLRMFYKSDADFERVGKELYEGIALYNIGISEVKMNTKNGKEFDWIFHSCNLYPDHPEKGQIISVMDVSNLKRTEKQLRKVNNALEIQKNAILKQSKIIDKEKGRIDDLLLNIFPVKIANELKLSGTVKPEYYENTSIMFTDFVGFTALSSSIPPAVLIEELNDVFSAFDSIMEKNSCERIKTIGDGYLGVCGLPEKNGDHARLLIRSGLDFINYLKIRNTQISERKLQIEWKIRIGINSGPVVAGVVGARRYMYDIFGDTVNLASRLEAAADTMTVCISESTYKLVQDKIICKAPVQKEIKGKGLISIYTVVKEV